MVFSPNSFRGAPHTHLATLTYPGGSTTAQEIALLKRRAPILSRRSPPCGSRTRSTRSEPGRTTWCSAIRGASALTLLVAVLVLGGALAAGHRHRVYDAVILKTAGRHARHSCWPPTRSNTSLLGVATAVFGMARRLGGRLRSSSPRS